MASLPVRSVYVKISPSLVIYEQCCRGLARKLWKKTWQSLTKLSEMATAKGVTTAQLSLAWVLTQGDDVFPIPGTKENSPLGGEFGLSLYNFVTRGVEEYSPVVEGYGGWTDSRAERVCFCGHPSIVGILDSEHIFCNVLCSSKLRALT